MIPYPNPDSGIAAWESIPEGIAVLFKHGHTYGYTYDSAGEENIRAMLGLAQAGSGLNTYISKYVKHRYAWKL